MRRLRFVVMLCALAPARAVAAPAMPVVVIETKGQTSTEMVARLLGELVAAGFTAVHRVMRAPPSDGDAAHAALTADSAAALVVPVPAVESVAVDLWLAGAGGQLTHRRIVADAQEDAARAPAVIALQTVEVLRSTSELTALPPAPAVSAPVIRPEESQLNDSRFTLGLGTTILVSPGQVGAQLAPILRLGWTPSPRVALRLAGSALGNRPEVTALEGSAKVTQSWLAVDGALQARPRARLRPLGALGGGAMRVAAAGRSEVPDATTRNQAVWCGFAAATLGLGAALTARHALRFEMAVAWFVPTPTVQIAGTIAARAGQPAVLGTLLWEMRL